MYATAKTTSQARTVNNTEALPVVVSANPLDLPAVTFKEGLDRRKANRAALMAWVRDALVDGIDFGKIHMVSRNKCQAGNECKSTSG